MEDLFVHVKTVFPDVKRDLDSLQVIYNDHEQLMGLIESVVGNRMTKSHVEGKRILIKPNWVRHPKKENDALCLCTHTNFILASLEYVLKLKPGSVLIGDAPVQGCHWSKLVTEPFYQAIQRISAEYSIPVVIKDFRRVHFDPAMNNAM